MDYQQHGAESPAHGAAGAGSYDGTSPLANKSEGSAPVAPELEDSDVEQQGKSSATVDDGSVSAGGASASPPDSVHHDGDRTKLVLALAEAVSKLVSEAQKRQQPGSQHQQLHDAAGREQHVNKEDELCTHASSLAGAPTDDDG